MKRIDSYDMLNIIGCLENIILIQQNVLNRIENIKCRVKNNEKKDLEGVNMNIEKVLVEVSKVLDLLELDYEVERLEKLEKESLKYFEKYGFDSTFKEEE